MLIGGVFDTILLDCRPGFISILVKGQGAKQTFANEAGGHRWQRISPTEKRGRVHTSTITVAVLDPLKSIKPIDLQDVEITAKRGSGAGGQHRNVTDSCIVATHIPTGEQVKIDGRDQHQNKRIALAILAQKIEDAAKAKQIKEQETKRKKQVGSGMRSDKVRTYRERDDRVTDHRTNQTWKLSRWRKGEW